VDPRIDVVGVGNAIVDVISTVPENFIAEHELAKGAMTLVDSERATALYAAMPPGIESSGGSAANTAVGVASFGGAAAYIGKVRDDQLGEVFAHDMRAAGVAYDVSPAPEGPPTARCLIQVTPDAERTMNTFLGISALLEPADVDEELVASAAITFCEGYLWDVDIAKEAIRKAMDIAHDAGRMVSLTLSDPFCVDRHRDEWLDLISDRVDLVFANQNEALAMFETDDFDKARDRLADLVQVAVITRSELGSVAISADGMFPTPPSDVPSVVDATGAGDLFASGFLFGMSRGESLIRCSELGHLAAGEVISHVGARPAVSLAELAGVT
jgi:sugar/nucleoside kinase (ribokinase family)